MRHIASAAVVSFLLAAGVARADDAAANFAKKCSACHGKDGKGQTKMGEKMGIKDLTATKASAAEVEKTVADGRGKMPAFKAKLSGDEIKALAAYIEAGLK